MRIIALIALVSILALCAAPALALPTVDELVERAEKFAAEAKQYTCRVSIEDAAGSATGRLRARENKFQLELERKDEAGALLGIESWIFDGETIWMAMRPGGRPIPTVIKMEVKRIEEHARRIEDDVRLERLDRGVNPFTAIASLRRDFDLSVAEEIRDGEIELVMVEARLKPIDERQPTWTGAPHIRLLVDRSRGIPYHVARFNYDGEQVFSMTFGAGNTQIPVTQVHVSYTPPRQAEVQNIADMFEEVERELRE